MSKVTYSCGCTVKHGWNHAVYTPCKLHDGKKLSEVFRELEQKQ